MIFNNCIDAVKKTSLYALLLSLSMTIQAQPAETEVAATGDSPATDTAYRPRQAFSFPRWPERHHESRERIPPPPPGPYMSSALSGSYLEGLSFDRDQRAAMRPESPRTSKPMGEFNPDTPWPNSNHAGSPDLWKPESGYNYVKPAANNLVYPARQPDSYYRYPVMKRPGYGVNTMPYSGVSSGMNPGR